MKLLYTLAWIIFLCATPIIASAEKIDDDFFIKHLQTRQYDLDTEAAAVVLYEKGTTTINLGTNKYYTVYRIYRIIKIIKPSAFDEADVKYGYYDTKSFSSSASNIRGATYTLNSGQLLKTTMQKDAIFDKHIDENHSELRFTLPAIQVGCIIEYSYDIQSPLGLDVPSWSFQDKYPTLKSQYEMSVPNNLLYTYVTQGMPPVKTYSSYKKAEAANDSSFLSTEPNLTGGTSNIWSRKNIPPLKSEPFISSLSNHVERIDLQLSGVENGGFDNKNIYNSWKKANEQLWNDEKFGMVLRKNNNFLEGIVDSLTQNVVDPLAKAQKIFSYVRANFYCEDSIAFWPKRSIAKVFENKTGSAAEINFLLTIMLRKAGLNSSPVILGTLGSLKVSELYPVRERFTNTVSICFINDKRYMLDASGRYNIFGTLPLYCYNGYARVIDKEGKDLRLTAYDIKERNVMVVTISEITDTGYNMRISEVYGKFQSRALRQSWFHDPQAQAAFINERVSTLADNGDLIERKIDNFNNPDTSLVVKYTVHQRLERAASILYLPTDIMKQFTASPFKAMERRLPVELPYQMEFVYALNMKLPDNIEPEDVPKGGLITYEDDKMSFRHLVGYDSEMRYVSVSSKFVATQTIYPAHEYETLRDFFEKMIVEQNKVITLKVKK